MFYEDFTSRPHERALALEHLDRVFCIVDFLQPFIETSIFVEKTNVLWYKHTGKGKRVVESGCGPNSSFKEMTFCSPGAVNWQVNWYLPFLQQFKYDKSVANTKWSILSPFTLENASYQTLIVSTALELFIPNSDLLVVTGESAEIGYKRVTKRKLLYTEFNNEETQQPLFETQMWPKNYDPRFMALLPHYRWLYWLHCNAQRCNNSS
jgi:hypothetical protein